MLKHSEELKGTAKLGGNYLSICHYDDPFDIIQWSLKKNIDQRSFKIRGRL